MRQLQRSHGGWVHRMKDVMNAYQCLSVSVIYTTSTSYHHCSLWPTTWQIHIELSVHVCVSVRHQLTLSHCHTVTQSQSHTVTLSHCHAVTLSHWHTVTLSHSHTVTLSHCHAVTLSRCHTVTLTHCHTVTLSHCHAVTLSHCHTVTHGYIVSLLPSLHYYSLPTRDGQAELTWVAGYTLEWFNRLLMVTHPSTNRVQCWAVLIGTNVLPLRMIQHCCYKRLEMLSLKCLSEHYRLWNWQNK